MSEPASPVPSMHCALCGKTIPPDAPGRGCPSCLLGAGVPTGGRSVDDGADDDALGAADVAARFPDYEILGLLGRGGMGVVWKARHRALDRVVALKVLPKDVAKVAGFSDRFQREARALARLAHPNIVAVHEFGEREGAFYLVMEFVDGVNMRQALREGRAGARDVLRIVPQICDALQYAHDHGVVHRDIKPENVLLDAQGRVKVADFGLAKIMASDGAPELTVTGQVMGTPMYMAPEQWERPASVDHRADIYSLGVVFYEMLTGELPLGRFDAPSKRVQVDVRFDEVVLRSLEKQPERRWQHASDVKGEVRTIASSPPPAVDAIGVATGRAARSQDSARSIRIARADPSHATLNRLGVVAFGLAVAFAPLMLVGGWLASSMPSLGIAVLSLAGGCKLGAIVCGITAWVRIVRSHGEQRGLAYAVIACLLPLVVTCAGIPALWLSVGGVQPSGPDPLVYDVPSAPEAPDQPPK